MIDNRPRLQALLKSEGIWLEPDACLERDPGAMPASMPFDRIEGMLLGLAIGDSLGNTTESQNPHKRKANRGEIRDYLPHPYAGNQAVGLPSDDTQLAFWTLEQLIADNGLVPPNLAQRLTAGQIFGMGQTMREFLVQYKSKKRAWDRAGVASAGNGALMRIAPVLLPHLKNPSSALYADAALAAMITHNDPASNAACVAFIHLLWQALQLEQPPERGWWSRTFLEVMTPLEGKSQYSPRSPLVKFEHDGPVSAFAAVRVPEALAANATVLDACESWHSGAYLLETVPSFLFILDTCGHDPEEAIVRAVNDTRDNDTIASIVGTAVGALHGAQALPARWREKLLGRTKADDDGRVQELIQQARQAFWH